MSVIDNSNLGTLWNRILGLFSARKINNKSLAKDITINDEDIPSTAVNGETTVEGALGNIADQLSSQSQQIDELQDAIRYSRVLNQVKILHSPNQSFTKYYNIENDLLNENNTNEANKIIDFNEIRLRTKRRVKDERILFNRI